MIFGEEREREREGDKYDLHIKGLKHVIITMTEYHTGCSCQYLRVHYIQ